MNIESKNLDQYPMLSVRFQNILLVDKNRYGRLSGVSSTFILDDERGTLRRHQFLVVVDGQDDHELRVP